MPITFPYDFNTRTVAVLALKGVIALLAVMLLAGIVMLAVRHDIAGALGTLPGDAVLIALGRALLRGLAGAEGRITGDAVEARARRVWGITLPGPVGTFALGDFRAVQVERALASGNHTTTLHPIERVTLAGKPGTPDVCVFDARVDDDSPGEALAAALGLPCEVMRSPARTTWPGGSHARRRKT